MVLQEWWSLPSADTTLTWVSENAPNALLYGSLFEAYTYMKGRKGYVGSV